jgi:hypothetical protein
MTENKIDSIPRLGIDEPELSDIGGSICHIVLSTEKRKSSVT